LQNLLLDVFSPHVVRACYSYEKAKTDMASALTILNNYLVDKTYLVGHQVTLADIYVSSVLLYPFKLVTDKNFLKPYSNVVRWFSTCVNQTEFTQVIGKVVMCKKELQAPGQTAASGGVKKPKAAAGDAKTEKAAKKEKAIAVADDQDEEPVVVEKKAEHPYKIMDREHPSPFSMDAWKKIYSNATSYDDAMNEFWTIFDATGWSLWLQEYKYNEENKRTFMTSNAVTGFQQRSDEIRKWAFGVMDVLGTEETALEIAGIWLFRGQTVDCMTAANDDANWYSWTLLAGADLPPTDDVKAKVKAYWTEEETLEGKAIQDSKVFK
jgi:elongation factor 1-gamma